MTQNDAVPAKCEFMTSSSDIPAKFWIYDVIIRNRL